MTRHTKPGFPVCTVRAIIFDSDMREIDAWTYRVHVDAERRDAGRRIHAAMAAGHGVWTKAAGGPKKSRRHDFSPCAAACNGVQP